jgi:large subunit ribosomal protein L10
MAKSRAQKQKAFEELVEKIKRQKSIVFFDFTGMKVEDMTKLRKKMKEEGSEIKVVKKTLLKIVLEKLGIFLDAKKLKGEVALAFGFEDEISPAKLCYQFSQGNPNLKILGGFFEGKIRETEEIITLAQLPSRELLLAKLMQSMAAPLSNIIMVLKGNIKGLINILAKAKT